MLMTACATAPDSPAHRSSETNATKQGAAPPAKVTIERAKLPSSAELKDHPTIAIAAARGIWPRLREGFALPDRNHPAVQDMLASMSPSTARIIFERARPYLHLIVEEIEARGMPMEIALLPAVESGFDPFAYSHGRAAGLWQFIPETGRHYGLAQTWWYDGRRDILASTNAALDYLQALAKRFDGDWLLALAAYNAGPGTVSRAISNNAERGEPTDFWHLRLRQETRRYVPKLLAFSRLVAEPGLKSLALPQIPDSPYLGVIELSSQIDLGVAAELAGLNLDEFYHYNAGFNRWITAPDGPHRLLVPREHHDRLAERLAKLDKHERLSWHRHRIRPGENLQGLAARYNTTVAAIRQINRISGHLIRAGDHLMIPQRKGQAQVTLAELRYRGPQQANRKNRHVHVVEAGESLWEIGRRYGVSPAQLARWNGLSDSRRIHPGQSLTLWTQQTGANGAMHPTRRVIYTVRRGDSLYAISRRFNVGINDLRRWNTLDGRYLMPGDRLILHVDVTAQSS